jgi:hypothetical protein
MIADDSKRLRPAIILIASAIILLSSMLSAAAPVIDSQANNVTNDDSTYIVINFSQCVYFNVTANESVDSWTWHADGADQSRDAPNITLCYTTWGYHNLTVNATNAAGSAGAAYRVWVIRERSDTLEEPIDETGFEMLEGSFDDEPSWTDFTGAISHPYTSMVGSIFFLFLFGLPLLMIYIRQDAINIPATIMFMFGAVILFLLPPQWLLIGEALMALALFGAMYKIYKERER